MVLMDRKEIYLLRNGLKPDITTRLFLGIISPSRCYLQNILTDDSLLGVKH